MVITAQLSENSHRGFEVQKPACIGLESRLSQIAHWGCGHVYDETPVGIVVYVRNDPVNLVDPDGRRPQRRRFMPIWGVIWTTYDVGEGKVSIAT